MEIIIFRKHDNISMSDNDREVREPECERYTKNMSDNDKEVQEPECGRYMKKKSLKNSSLVRQPSMELVLHIVGGEGIDVDDEDEANGSVKRRRYCACVGHWMEPDKGYYTQEAQAAFWNQLYCIPIIENIPGNYGFLYVEVARLHSKTDPGTSSGAIIVGRAKVPLPREPYKEVEGRFELGRPSGDGHMCFAGNIILRMVLREQR